METGIYIRPDNLAYSFEKTCDELVLAGLEKEAKICIIQHVDSTTLKQIFSLWDTKQLEKIMKCIVEILRTGLKIMLTPL